MKFLGWFGFYDYKDRNTIYLHSKFRLFLWTFIVLPIIFPLAFVIYISWAILYTIWKIMEGIWEAIKDTHYTFFDEKGLWKYLFFSPFMMIYSFFRRKRVVVPKEEFENRRTRHGRFHVSTLEEFDEEFGK